MFPILFFISLGIFLGVFLQFKRRRIIAWVDKVVVFTVYILLFLLGINIGGNEEIVASLGTIGFQALLIALAGVAGSILSAYI
ncbi:TPA: hypothetical protein DEB02_02895, partial [Candidatus Beckwithbacteria bacterium]|nr:hypothetical protein [Candidatus Beckwithbacteria bacterium]